MTSSPFDAFAGMGVDPAQFGELLQEFIREKLMVKKPPFRDLWVAYAAYGTSVTDGGRTRIPSWESCHKSYQEMLLGYFGDLPYDQITLGKADDYRTWRRAQPRRDGKKGPIKAASINRELRCVQGCLSFAVKRNLIARHNLAGLQDEEGVHDRDFAIEQGSLMKIVRQARPQLRFFLLLLNETGMRRSELLQLVWSEVDLDTGFITLPKHRTKNKKGREIPLSTNARALLEMVLSDGLNQFVFPSPYKANGHLAKTTLHKWFRTACDVSGVTGPKGQPVWLHTMRHSFATDMAVLVGMDIETLMSIAGWSDVKVMKKYINIARRHREAAKSKMDSRGSDIRRELGTLGRMDPQRAPLTSEIVADVPVVAAKKGQAK